MHKKGRAKAVAARGRAATSKEAQRLWEACTRRKAGGNKKRTPRGGKREAALAGWVPSVAAKETKRNGERVRKRKPKATTDEVQGLWGAYTKGGWANAAAAWGACLTDEGKAYAPLGNAQESKAKASLQQRAGGRR